jgi:nuclear pore complex protein Nup205
VYEAKIGFLLSVAATRKGAEELLDAGLFEILSMCGFVAVQPIGGDSIGKLGHM